SSDRDGLRESARADRRRHLRCRGAAADRAGHPASPAGNAGIDSGVRRGGAHRGGRGGNAPRARGAFGMTRAREWTIAAAFIIVAVAVISIVVVNRRMEREVGSGTYVPKPARITPEITLLQQYVRIDT